jgi:TPR repeat protein
MARLGLLAFAVWCAAGIACWAQVATPRTGSARDCLQLGAGPWDISNEAAFRKRLQTWLDACKQATVENTDDPQLKVALARALSADGKRAEAVPLLRAAAAQNDPEANYELYETHKSYDRSDVSKTPLVPRAEAERSLRKAAELGHPYSMWILAVLLDRGSTVKRDPDDAILWAERAMAKPPKDTSQADIEIRLGHFLAKSAKSESKTRGVAILERYARGRGDAQSYLAIALRGSDPSRARTLLEQAVKSFPGHAVPTLADMLIKGEGGSADTKRALSLLRTKAQDVSAVKAALGRLYLDGRLMPRDAKEAVRLIRGDTIWSQESRLEVMGLLAANPEIEISNPNGFLYDATEAAELREPGALLALIDLKLSKSTQFADRAGGCALAERAAQRAQACRAN